MQSPCPTPTSPMADPACSSPYRFLLHQEEPSLFFSTQGPGQPLPIHSLEMDLFCARPCSRCCSKLCRPRCTRRRKAGTSKPISYTRMLSGLTCPRRPRGQPGLSEVPARTRSASRPTPAGPRCRPRSPTLCAPCVYPRTCQHDVHRKLVPSRYAAFTWRWLLQLCSLRTI